MQNTDNFWDIFMGQEDLDKKLDTLDKIHQLTDDVKKAEILYNISHLILSSKNKQLYKKFLEIFVGIENSAAKTKLLEKLFNISSHSIAPSVYIILLDKIRQLTDDEKKYPILKIILPPLMLNKKK